MSGRPETAGKNPGGDAGRVGRLSAKVPQVADLRHPLAVLDQLDEAHAKATPGPWDFDRDRLCANNETGDFLFDFRDVVLVEDNPIGVQGCAADGELIVAAVNALPDLTAALRAVLDLAEEFDKRAMYGGALVWTRIRSTVTAALAAGGTQ